MDVTYFRANIAGMSWLRSVMLDLDMMALSTMPPKWPEPGDFGTNWEEVEAAQTDGTRNERTGAFLNAQLSTRAARGHDGDVMGEHKFGSNDGWIVTPSEIEASLRAYNECRTANPRIYTVTQERIDELGNRDFWERWLVFLEVCRLHDGMQVW